MEPGLKKRGRPLGSKNRPKHTRQEGHFTPKGIYDKTPPIKDATDPQRKVDPMRVVDDQLRILAWTQELIIAELELARGASSPPTTVDVRRLADMSTAISSAIVSMKRVGDIAEEIAARKSPAELLEMAIAKVEGQDMATINYAIRRLKAMRDRYGSALSTRDDAKTAADAIASLEDE